MPFWWHCDIRHNSIQNNDTQNGKKIFNTQHNHKNLTLRITFILLHFICVLSRNKSHRVECHYAECRHAYCRGAILNVGLSLTLLLFFISSFTFENCSWQSSYQSLTNPIKINSPEKSSTFNKSLTTDLSNITCLVPGTLFTKLHFLVTIRMRRIR